jgi:hypothetical protein
MTTVPQREELYKYVTKNAASGEFCKLFEEVTDWWDLLADMHTPAVIVEREDSRRCLATLMKIQAVCNPSSTVSSAKALLVKCTEVFAHIQNSSQCIIFSLMRGWGWDTRDQGTALMWTCFVFS